ncbi:PE-PPE domain-containing protein [Mycobacterium sp. JS623]|uniref:PE-PPE domain-containing protein n=1 Tax=Mycobacterium sp. JS623 TaxID=212767 RepID=UPI0002A5AFEF|nr:PE-PPE domain-containing protein [Mycobacterium sp. JS623]AGB21365.1 PE-PPE domain-containing protein [Mycobacterium sp. JS623]
MRKSAHALGLVVVSLFSAAILGVMSAFTAAFALGAATALVVPGTGTPNANTVENYLIHARDYYMQGTMCTNNANCPLNVTGNPANPGLLGVNYPASFWPLGFIGNWCPGYTCDTWDVSVGTGVNNLNTALTAASGPVVVFGYSQGGAVVATELSNIRNNPELLAKIDKVVTIGGIENPDGGLWTRLSFIPYVPILNITPHPAMPVDIGALQGKFYTVGFEYDPVVYAPLYWGNPFTMLNALAAFQTVHGNYLTPNGNGPTDPIAYGYTPTTLAEQLNCTAHPANCRTDQYGNTYVMIPARSLPIVDLVTGLLPSQLQPVVKPVADLVSPVLKVLIDLGYDWSGDPSVVRPLSPLPFNPIQNWPAVGVNLLGAAVQGVQAFLGDLGGLTTMIAPTAPAPLSPTPVSTFAARSAPAEDTAMLAVDQGSESDAKTAAPALKLVEESDPPAQKAAVENHTPNTTPESTADETKVDETKVDETKVDEKKVDEKKVDEKKVDETKVDEKKVDEKNVDEKKADNTKSDNTKSDNAKSDNDKKSDSDKKDADTAKAAA